MDDAAAILEDLPPAEQEAASFGAMLERAMAQWETREATKAGSEEPEAKAAEAEAAPTAAAAASAPEEGKAAETDEAPTAAAPMEEATAAGTGEAPTAAAAAEEAEKANAEDANGGAPAAAEPEEAVQVQEEGQPGKDAEGAATALPDLPSAEDGADKEATGDASAGPIAVPRHAEAAPQPTAGDTIANGTVPQKDHLPSEDGTTPAAAAALPAKLSADHLRVLNWHWANLEYGCSAPLNALSAEHWNQDEDFGGFGGPHCMVVGGYDQVFRRLASLLDVRLSTRVASIKTRQEMDSVEVITAAGESIWADAVVVTVPLGVLKAGGLAFDPPLPQWKQDAVQKLGFGDLNKVVLQFPSVFWDDSVDFFGAVHSEHNDAERGWNYMFWNFHRFSGVPILAALVAGEAAKAAETLEESELSARAMATLRTLHPGSTIPEPVAVAVSRWASEPFSRGSYSYVSVGATGEDYDQLAKPVARRVLFAGEHTVKEHPDTVGGAMLSGLREAVRALDILIADKREGVAMAAEVSEAVAQLKRKQSEGAERGGRSKKPKSSGNGRSENRTRGRSGSGDDVDMGQDDDDLEARFDRAMGRDVARMQEEMRVREAARQATKEFWRGLMAAESGDAAVFADVLQGTAAEDVQARTTAARCLSQAPSKAMKTIARDERTMQLFTEWVVDAAGDNSLIALLDLLLKALRVMPVDAAMAEKTGLLKVVRQRCAIHSDPDVRKLAGYISRSWVTPPAAGAGSAAPGSKPAAVPPAPKKVELDEETKRKLEEAEAEIRRLDEMAAALRAQAEAKKQTASSFADDGPLRALPSFQEYKEALKGNKKKPKAKMERISERQAGAGGSGGATNGGGSGPLDVRQRLEKMVADFLKPFYERRQVNKEQFKAIVAKTREKVLSKATETDLANGKKFLDGRRQGIGRLVADYVAAYSQKR